MAELDDGMTDDVWEQLFGGDLDVRLIAIIDII